MEIGRVGINFVRSEFRVYGTIVFATLTLLHNDRFLPSFHHCYWTDGEEDGEARMTRDLADEMLTLLIVILSERFVVGIGQVCSRRCDVDCRIMIPYSP